MIFSTCILILLHSLATCTLVPLEIQGCPNGFVRCARASKCIKPKWICDGSNDCGNGSDELYCDSVYDCGKSSYSCSTGSSWSSCFRTEYYCDNKNNCDDSSDEIFCNIDTTTLCPEGMIKCTNNRRCYPEKFQCDGYPNCEDASDESLCFITTRDPDEYSTTTTTTQKPPDLRYEAVYKGIQWLLNQRKGGSTNDRWGPQLHRIATALFLAEPGFFTPGNRTGEEMSYELTIKLLSQFNGNSTLRSGELALYVQALLVTCEDPRDVFGRNLVSELRRKVEASKFTNPFEVLTLCNAGDQMTPGDVQKVSEAYESAQRPFWTDTQAIAAMAMQCLFSTSTALDVDERVVKDMQDELKKRQFRNGSVENLITTALVVQAMLSNASYIDHFNMPGALSVLINNQKSSGSWGSIQKDYYILPALSMQSLVNVSSKHCIKSPTSEEDALHSLQEARGEKFVVLHSVWFGKDVDLGRTWRVRMPTARNISFYDVIETVKKLDAKHNVAYNVVENKPYVYSLFGKEDDPELGLFWFTYVRSTLTSDAPKRIDTSPVFVKVQPNQELILWYKPGNWEVNSTQEES